MNKLAWQCYGFGKKKACKELEKIALQDKDAGARSAAVAELPDRSLLRKIAVEDKAASVRSAAVSRLTLQSLLAKIAVEDKEESVRSAAMAKLTNPSLLANIAVKATDASVRSLAVARLADQSLLAKIAVGDADAGVRSSAVERLGDQSLLATIAVGDKEESVRGVAMAKLTDSSLLAKIAVEAADASVRRLAATQLADQSLLAKIAVGDADAGVRRAAAARLGDRSLLAKIAVEDKDAGVRTAAVAAEQQIQRDFTEGRDIVDLLGEKKIEIRAQGNGIQSVSLSVRSLVPYPLTVRIPVGIFFVSSNPSAQNMVTTGESRVQLTTDQWLSTGVAAACANRPRHIPGGGDEFTVTHASNQSELAKLMPALDRARVNTATRQAAVWIVTDDATYYDLGILVVGRYGFGGSRVINEQETARAMKICDEAGIDITKKAIWRDRGRVSAGLRDVELWTWLEHKQ